MFESAACFLLHPLLRDLNTLSSSREQWCHVSALIIKYLSAEMKRREGEEEANMKNTTRQRKRKRSLGTGGVWEKKRQIEKRGKAQKILYAVECLSYQGGWLREWAKRIRGHDGENVRRQINHKYKENETEAAAWCGKNKDRRSKRGGRNEERQTGW